MNYYYSTSKPFELPDLPLLSLGGGFRKSVYTNQTSSGHVDSPAQMTFKKSRQSINNQNSRVKRMEYVKGRCMISSFSSRDELKLSQSQTVFQSIKKLEKNKSPFTTHLVLSKQQTSQNNQGLQEKLQQFCGKSIKAVQIQEFLRVYFQKLALERKLMLISNSSSQKHIYH